LTTFFTVVTMLVALTIVAPLIRIARGPTVFDRLVSAAQITATSVLLLLLIGVLFGRVELFADIAVSYALLAFLGPVALARYFQTGPRR
jgi:multicomponent Na+:H+ antiporter subunit F